MRTQRVWRRLCLLTPAIGLLPIGACSGALRNLDRLLSPGAFENALTLPYNAVLPLFAFFTRFA
ncbi:hypothetical protein RAS1_24560 [Phycisphaerae bacterium RAS1]|nr:hypothetical protein RAS1_24560 [Phycisphaerae bacterium RAS1]